MKSALWIGLSIAVCAAPSARGQEAEDPYLWLEEVEGERALEWVGSHNESTVAVLESHPEFQKIFDRNLEILNSEERIPYASIRGNYVYNFWQDAAHERGIWRRTTLSDYQNPTPSWEIVLDVDKLAEAEAENWVWKGSSCLYPEYTRCMINLSRGGADATVKREFDVNAGAFVENGFRLAEAKGSVSWLTENSLYVGTDFGDASMTTSGYPRIVKLWKRGTPLEAAETVFEGRIDDVGTWGYVTHTPEGVYEVVTRAVTFWESEKYMRLGGRVVRLDIPADANFHGVFKEQMLIDLKSAWDLGSVTYPQGALLSIGLDDFLAGSRDFSIVVVPDERSSVSGINTTKNLLLVSMSENVRSVLYHYRLVGGEWQKEKVEAPPYGTISLGSSDEKSDAYFFNFNNFLIPSSLYLVTVDESGADIKRVKGLPEFFDSSELTVEQFEIASKDGEMIPYFVVRRKDLVMDGTNPTLLYGYGGFEVSMEPYYSATTGSAWLSRGGTYVLANIRGGGEFGPRWHQAALKENRQRAFDDFIAVAEDLIARKITSPQHLGIMGGSNGGLLVGAVFAQRPELFSAVVCQVPLLDMKRYNKLLAGASWMAEYGNPDVPEEWEFIRQYSPYHNISGELRYPKVFFVTSTRDDRVHPGHARKMVARMSDLGHDVYYFENTEGGHAAATNNKQRAYMGALRFSYLLQQLAPAG